MAFTLYRGAYKTAPRVPTLGGVSDDTKPTTNPDGSSIGNGATYEEINTGKIFRFDEDGNQWREGEEQ